MTNYFRSGDDIDRGLVGYWKLDDLRVSTSTAIDRANFNDGTITGATSAPDLNGITGNAMNFDGNDKVSLGTPAILDLRVKASISLRIKLDTLSPTVDFPEIYDTADGGGTKKGMVIFYSKAANTFAFLLRNNGSVVVNVPTTKDDWVTNTWYHLGVAWDSTLAEKNVQWYIDGVPENSADDTDVPDGISSDIAIGNLHEGDLNKVRVYNRTLTHGEFSKLHRLRK